MRISIFLKSCFPIVLSQVLFLAPALRAQVPNSIADDFDQKGFSTDCAYFNTFGGPVVTVRNGQSQESAMAGLTIGQYFARTLGKGETLSPQFELGLIGPLPDGHPLDGLVSVDMMLANKVPAHHTYLSATAGYTRFFATGDALNFGVGVDFGKHEYDRLLRIEVRDYYLVDGPRQNVVSLRFGFGKMISD